MIAAFRGGVTCDKSHDLILTRRPQSAKSFVHPGRTGPDALRVRQSLEVGQGSQVNPGPKRDDLALNGRPTYGSLSIRHVLGAPMFVMSRTLPRDWARASELRGAIIGIARRSDQIEQQLIQLDQY